MFGLIPEKTWRKHWFNELSHLHERVQTFLLSSTPDSSTVHRWRCSLSLLPHVFAALSVKKTELRYQHGSTEFIFTFSVTMSLSMHLFLTLYEYCKMGPSGVAWLTGAQVESSPSVINSPPSPETKLTQEDSVFKISNTLFINTEMISTCNDALVFLLFLQIISVKNKNHSYFRFSTWIIPSHNGLPPARDTLPSVTRTNGPGK